MNLEDFRDHCLRFKGVTEGFPFDKHTLVFKVANKMFALCDLEGFNGANLKCDPERAIELRERFSGIKPGYHMNKLHWNTVSIHEDVDDLLFFELIDHSYQLVLLSLPKKIRLELQD